MTFDQGREKVSKIKEIMLSKVKLEHKITTLYYIYNGNKQTLTDLTFNLYS